MKEENAPTSAITASVRESRRERFMVGLPFGLLLAWLCCGGYRTNHGELLNSSSLHFD